MGAAHSAVATLNQAWLRFRAGEVPDPRNVVGMQLQRGLGEREYLCTCDDDTICGNNGRWKFLGISSSLGWWIPPSYLDKFDRTAQASNTPLINDICALVIASQLTNGRWVL